MKGFKGFDKDLKCQNFQYEIGKDYEEERAKVCQAGFHFCENPLEVFNYYPPAAGNRYCEVEGSGQIDEHCDNSKVACSKIHIGAEIGLNKLVQSGIKFILERVNWDGSREFDTNRNSAATNTDDYSAAANTGDRSVATNTGNYSAATNTGRHSAATNKGRRSAATNTGDYSAATNTGYQSAATNTGRHSAATNTGYQSAAANTGDYSAATNTGRHSAATNTGYQSAATNTGYQSAATNTGNYSAATNTGYQGAACVEGKESVAMAIGRESSARGALGCWIVLSEWTKDENGAWHITDVQSTKVDGKQIKADTWYILKDGEFVEV